MPARGRTDCASATPRSRRGPKETRLLSDEKGTGTKSDKQITGGGTTPRSIFKLFSAPPTSSRKTPKRRIKTPETSKPDVDFAAILNSDEPCARLPSRMSFVDGIFDKFMEIDPYASIWRFIPRESPILPEPPLTLFSPVKERPPNIFEPCIGSVSSFDLDKKILFDNKETSDEQQQELLGEVATPTSSKHLDVKAYSPRNTIETGNFSSPSPVSRRTGLHETPQASTTTCSSVYDPYRTPISNSTTSEPMSGVTSLTVHVPTTPARSPSYFPDPPHPDAGKSTILFGIVCFVEVKYNEDDRSEFIKTEVISLGGKVENNFTKKVTHVMFKQGRLSTYMKAKELNIPIVSLQWLEACKVVEGLVDPALYAPSYDYEYQKLIPLEEAKKRERFRRRARAFLDRINGIVPAKTSKPSSRAKAKRVVSLTEVKNNPRSVRCKKAVAGPKKLDFEGDYFEKVEKKMTDATEPSQRVTAGGRKMRESAPTNLTEAISAAQPKLTTLFNRQADQLRRKDEETESSAQPQSDENLLPPTDNLMGVLTGGCYLSAKSKRRKLFNPNESVSLTRGVLEKPTSTGPPITEEVTHTSSEVDLTLRPRRSSVAYFVDKRTTKNVTKTTPKVAFTGLLSDELTKYKKIIAQLGIFEVDASVSKRTTHLVTTSPAKRTIKLLKGLARGCWILDVKWLVCSEANGKWMSEEPFELKSFSEAVTTRRLERQAFGKNQALDLFSTTGPISVESTVQPSRSDLVELLKLCKGEIAVDSSLAAVVVTDVQLSDGTPDKTLVSPRWVLDSITLNKLLPLEAYRTMRIA